jgi:hypothetical protein
VLEFLGAIIKATIELALIIGSRNPGHALEKKLELGRVFRQIYFCLIVECYSYLAAFKAHFLQTFHHSAQGIH